MALNPPALRPQRPYVLPLQHVTENPFLVLVLR